jgi:hypothetical protein
MSVRNEAELKALFQTGDTPLQQDFSDWIETMFANDATATQAAEDAAASAAAAEVSVSGLGFSYFVVAKYAAGVWTIQGGHKNVASVTRISDSKVRITFAVAFANTDYAAATGLGLLKGQNGQLLTVTRNVAYVEITQSGGLNDNYNAGTYIFFG